MASDVVLPGGATLTGPTKSVGRIRQSRHPAIINFLTGNHRCPNGNSRH
ncbi:hypothetical protein HMPREF0208_04075 [Citrobacter koseri]|nr:hypothetical protein HMPREF3207_02015 [Citrobacter koseri]KXB40760.1 hypothetical protein HMPREF0208_04075 [Citrobacter koseri]